MIKECVDVKMIEREFCLGRDVEVVPRTGISGLLHENMYDEAQCAWGSAQLCRRNKMWQRKSKTLRQVLRLLDNRLMYGGGWCNSDKCRGWESVAVGVVHYKMGQDQGPRKGYATAQLQLNTIWGKRKSVYNQPRCSSSRPDGRPCGRLPPGGTAASLQ